MSGYIFREVAVEIQAVQGNKTMSCKHFWSYRKPPIFWKFQKKNLE